ncbi:hypothetical protein ACTOB_003921 [Actinoplanes oblitus]|uniref:Uncharacterized protein n=1 Tax=Actinoplanes oblitus TaxID=3040509 RepID=A0ABY8WQP8_9ACTN|nr:hypothetical protein [Actinoplanes oblitus]WIN00227.1 hypothetical protein ACTOB_003921 [Actinoplanes oblitus]
MRLGTKAGAAAVLFIAGLAGAGWILAGQGLDRAEKWISIGGVCVSTLLGVAGLVLGWMTWRQETTARADVPAVTAGGPGGVGVGGDNGGEIRTDVSGARPPAAATSSGVAGTHATGAGSVAVGGNNTASITTRVDGSDGRPRP